MKPFIYTLVLPAAFVISSCATGGGGEPALYLEYVKQGRAYHEKGSYEQAAASYTQAIALNSMHAVTYALRGLAYYEKGDYDRAVADYDQLIKLDPHNAAAYAVRARRSRAALRQESAEFP